MLYQDRIVAVASRSLSQNSGLRNIVLSRYPSAKFNDTGRYLSQEELVEFLRGVERAIVSLEKMDASVFDRLPDLKVVSKYGVGLDNIDLDACADRDIQVSWKGGLNRTSVAELTLMMMLNAMRSVFPSRDKLIQGVWSGAPGVQLSNKCIGILGFGNVGQELARLLAPFQCRVLYCDIRDRSFEAKRLNVESTPFEDLLPQVDLLTIHTPLDESTRMLMDQNRIAQMKRGAVLINTARGGIVDEQALLDALKSAHLSAAALDVFAVEPPVDRRLLELPQFLGTPHIGGSSKEAIWAMGMSAIDGLEQFEPANALIQRLNA